MATLAELRNIRLEKLEKLKQLGVDPFPAKSAKKALNKDIVGSFDKLEGKSAVAAGRITAIRSYKDLAFIDVKDSSGKIQLYIKRDVLEKPNYKKSEIAFDDLGLLDLGDFVEGIGILTKTKTNEISIESKSLRILSKSIRPLPDKWEGFKDIEERYRRRYVDFQINDGAKKIIDTRWKIEKEIRKFLWSKNFDEVETPILQPLYGGTNARPFSTHFNALDCDFYLRVAPELYLKRLIVGGYERVFEIARNFRNEGIDHSHFPEFTMLEWYEAYADYNRVMDLAEALTKHLVKKMAGSGTIVVNGQTVDIAKKWRRVTVDKLLKEHLDIDWNKVTDDEAKELQKKYKINVRGTWDKNKVLFYLYDSEITSKLIEPTWVIDYPAAVSPLSRAHRTKAGRAERFEGYIGGVEIFDGWSEIVSGIEQRERFETEQKNMKEGDTEAMPLDEDFIEALEYGCPPLGGIGFGIDRLVMFLTDTWAIKDVVAFPTLKPKTKEKDVKVQPVQKIELTLDSAKKLLQTNVQNLNLQRHCFAVGKTLAAFYDLYVAEGRPTGTLTREQWEIIGTLHDADWEITTDTPNKHTLLLLEWLGQYDVSEEMLNVFRSHNNPHTHLREPETLLEWTLECCDELTGFTVAVTLVRPEKQLLLVEAASVLKKFKQKEFARQVSREQIAQCESKLNIPLEKFIEITLATMQKDHELLGL